VPALRPRMILGTAKGYTKVMRVTIRFTLNTDTNSALGNKLNATLTNAGFAIAPPPDTMLPGTATYRMANMQVSQLGPVLQEFWDAAANDDGPGPHTPVATKNSIGAVDIGNFEDRYRIDALR
jgi:hypothetical protein